MDNLRFMECTHRMLASNINNLTCPHACVNKFYQIHCCHGKPNELCLKNFCYNINRDLFEIYYCRSCLHVIIQKNQNVNGMYCVKCLANILKRLSINFFLGLEQSKFSKFNLSAHQRIRTSTKFRHGYIHVISLVIFFPLNKKDINNCFSRFSGNN